MGYIDKIRTFMFPRIKDWKAAYSEKKYREDWWNMSNVEFIIFHQKGTKWFIFGVSSLGFTAAMIGGIYVLLHHEPILSIIPFIMAFFLGKATFLKLRSWNRPTLTFYELILRDR